MLQEKLRNRCQNSWQQKKHRPSLSRYGTSRLQQKKLEQHGWSQNGYGGAGTHTRAHRPFHTHAGTPPFSTCIVPFGPLPKNVHTAAGSTWTRILSEIFVHTGARAAWTKNSRSTHAERNSKDVLHMQNVLQITARMWRASWGPLGGLLGASWGPLGVLLGASWGPLGGFLAKK